MDTTLADVLQIFLYQLIDLIPNLVLAFCAFGKEIRFSVRTNIVLCFLIYVMLSVSRVIALMNPLYALFMSVIWIVIYLGFYRFSIRAKLSKLLFVLLTLLNYGSFTVILVNYFSFYVFRDAAGYPYSFGSSLIYAVVLCLSYPFVYQLFHKKLKPLMEFPANTKIWKFLWLIPATFCLAYYYNLYSNGGIIVYAGSVKNVLFAVTFNAGALFVTYLVLRLVEDSNDRLRLEMESYQFSLQSIQYKNLKSQMDDARRARHDLRHTVNVLQAYLNDGNTKGLQNYIEQYLESLPSDSARLYSDDYTLNALLSIYEEKARKEQIRFQANIQLEGRVPLPEPDQVVLIGNLLENALEACIRQNSRDSYISFTIRREGKAVVILEDNSYDGIMKEQGKVLQSSKENHIGIGVSSIQKIVEKYNGILKFTQDDHVFQLSMILFPKN